MRVDNIKIRGDEIHITYNTQILDDMAICSTMIVKTHEVEKLLNELGYVKK